MLFQRLTLTLGGLVAVLALTAQINLQERLEQKAKERLERKVDRTIDKGFDKAEKGVDKGTREATKGKQRAGSPVEGGGDQGTPAPSAQQRGDAPATATGPAAATLKAYSKFDFISGEQVVAYEDFAQDAIGDFPAKWNTNSSGEVVTLEGHEGRWFQINGDGYFYPEFLEVLPENFTLEFDAVTGQEFNYYTTFIDLFFVSAANSNLLRPDQKGRVEVGIHPYQTTDKGSTRVEVHDVDGKNLIGNSREQHQLVVGGVAPKAHVAVWRQRNRLRVYLNEEKVWDLPRAFQPGIDYRLVLHGGAHDDGKPYFGNLRVAVGAPDTRNKLITEGKLVTRGILFDSGSDRIKPESYGTLKDIAAVLSENAGVRVRITGHTDSDGDAAMNLDLSKRRAAAVKEALTKEFGIDGGRMETDGKGETEPTAPNDSPQGKANNRRVEFVKL